MNWQLPNPDLAPVLEQCLERAERAAAQSNSAGQRRATQNRDELTRLLGPSPAAARIDLAGPAGAPVRIFAAGTGGALWYTFDAAGRLVTNLLPGTYDIEVLQPGYAPWRERHSLRAGDTFRRQVVLSIEDRAAAQGQKPPGPPPTATPPPAPDATAFGERWAVIIGVGRYDDPKIPTLRYSVADAEAMHRVLVEFGGFKKDNVLLLTDHADRKPTLRNIKWALGTFLARQAKRQDVVLVFFAGHGAPEVDLSGTERDGLAKYLIPSDAESDELYSTALPMDEIQTIFGRIEAERMVVLLDSCYSGAAGGRTFASSRIQTRDVRVDDLFLEKMLRAKGRALITASRPSEVSVELSELGHGLFTYYLIDGLRGKADADGDRIVTLQELYQYVAERVSSKSRAVGANQHPVLKGEIDGSLPLVRLPADSGR